MDQRLQYEQLIGEKLQGLSIPDMEDMIWARVKAQLDIDMPEDDKDGGENGPQSPVERGPLVWGLSIIIVALITTLLFLKNKPATTENIPSLPLITQPANQPANQPTGPPAANKITTATPLIPQVTTTPVGSSVDTASLQQDLSVPVITAIDGAKSDKPDSTFAQAQPPPVNIDTIHSKKKGKGVSGLKDDDYRIVPRNKE